MERIVGQGSDVVRYILTRKRVKNINLRIAPDGSVAVSAPSHLPVGEIDLFVLQKRAWIQRAQKRSSAHRDALYTYGEPVQYMGRSLSLVTQEGDKPPDIRGNVLYLYCLPGEEHVREKICRKVESFLTAEAIRLTTDISRQMHLTFERIYPNLTEPVLRYKQMHSRWGSCRRDTGVITLNIRLIQKPVPAMEYVMAHEYTHLFVSGHQRDFYELLSRIMPDYKERRKLLKSQQRG